MGMNLWVLVLVALIAFVLVLVWVLALVVKKRVVGGGFWSLQPVFHIYDLPYYVYSSFSPQVISTDVRKTPFYSDDVITQVMTEENTKNAEYWKDILSLLTDHYLNEGDNRFLPTHSMVAASFVREKDPSYISTWTMNSLLGGMITSRPIQLFSTTSPHHQAAYYIDYLCVHASYRSQGIAPKLIQTHEYNQRLGTPHRMVSVFKREQELTMIVPFTVFTTYGFPLHVLPPKETAPTAPDIRWLGEEDTEFVVNHLHESFPYRWMSTPMVIKEWLASKHILVSVSTSPPPYSFFFFRKTYTHIRKGVEALSCIGSICPPPHSPHILSLFLTSLHQALKQTSTHYLVMEDISDNSILLDHIQREKAEIQSPTAYYVYNYIHSTVPSSDVFVLI